MKIQVEIPDGENCFDPKTGVQCPLLWSMPGVMTKCQLHKEILGMDFMTQSFCKCDKCLQSKGNEK